MCLVVSLLVDDGDGIRLVRSDVVRRLGLRSGLMCRLSPVSSAQIRLCATSQRLIIFDKNTVRMQQTRR